MGALDDVTVERLDDIFVVEEHSIRGKPAKTKGEAAVSRLAQDMVDWLDGTCNWFELMKDVDYFAADVTRVREEYDSEWFDEILAEYEWRVAKK